MCSHLQATLWEKELTRTKSFIVSLLVAIGRKVLSTDPSDFLLYFWGCSMKTHDLAFSWVQDETAAHTWDLSSVSWLHSQGSIFTFSLLYHTTLLEYLLFAHDHLRGCFQLIWGVSVLGFIRFLLLTFNSYVLITSSSHCLTQLCSNHDFAFT